MIRRKFVNLSDFKNLKNISIGLHLELKEKDSAKEIKNQIKKFIKKFGYPPSHLDGHKHMHLTECNLPKVFKLAKKYSLPVRSNLPSSRQLIRRARLKTPDFFVSWYPNRLRTLSEKLKKTGGSVVEMVCHSGYFDKKSTSSYNKCRQQELAFLKNNLFRKMIKVFELINYAAL